MSQSSQEPAQVFINGQWRSANATGTFQASDPTTNQALPATFPISAWSDVDAALDAAENAAEALEACAPSQIAAFLNGYADRIDATADELAALASKETALPAAPRLKDVEIPRTSNQLRLCGKAAIDGAWALPTIDAEANIRSLHVPIGPMAIFGPNNFPFAFNGISGGDFAAAIAAGNPVLAKAHPLHPATTRRLGKLAAEALAESDLPAATVQMLYHFDNDVGLRLAGDRRLGALAFTGSRRGGLALKQAADAAGVPAYLELSSVNPVVLMPGALASRGEAIAEQYAQSCLMGVGQFCTKPGLVFAVNDDATRSFMTKVAHAFDAAANGTLFSADSKKGLLASLDELKSAGGEVVTGGGEAGPCAVENTLLRTTGEAFLKNPTGLQTEAFGNAGLVVLCDNVAQIAECLRHVEGNLTGCIYAENGDDYAAIERVLRRRVGRLLNDKMPTGVAVSPAMVHGGPYPSTGHPGFTAVGPPASLRRFSRLRCYDNVGQSRLPEALRS